MTPAGVILAGGRATRMNGRDKALLDLGGETLLARAAARLAPQVGALALNANGDRARFAAVSLPVLADSVPGRQGPLAGVLAGLDWAAGAGAAAIVTVAVDTPFFPADLAARLMAAGAPVALAATPDAGGRPRRHPTFGLWPVALREDLRAALAAGTRRVTGWADGHAAAAVPFPAGEDDPFFNINTPAELARARMLVQTKG